MYKLDSQWNLWYHSINDQNWEKSSYKKLIQLKTLYDYKLIVSCFKKNHYQNGMFFLMKDGIFPNWEDPLNRNGSFLSFKVSSGNVISGWSELLFECINETIMNDDNKEINGISISPKKEFNIVKIWFTTTNEKKHKSNFKELNNDLVLKNCLYKKHF